MRVVNVLRAKFTLSRLVKAIEQGQERGIVIGRGGRLVAKLVPSEKVPTGTRIEVAKGAFEVPDSIDTCNIEIAELFLGGVNP